MPKTIMTCKQCHGRVVRRMREKYGVCSLWCAKCHAWRMADQVRAAVDPEKDS